MMALATAAAIDRNIVSSPPADADSVDRRERPSFDENLNLSRRARPRSPRRMSDMNNLDRVGLDPVKNLVRILSDRLDQHGPLICRGSPTRLLCNECYPGMNRAEHIARSDSAWKCNL